MTIRPTPKSLFLQLDNMDIRHILKEQLLEANPKGVVDGDGTVVLKQDELGLLTYIEPRWGKHFKPSRGKYRTTNFKYFEYEMIMDQVQSAKKNRSADPFGEMKKKLESPVAKSLFSKLEKAAQK